MYRGSIYGHRHECVQMASTLHAPSGWAGPRTSRDAGNGTTPRKRKCKDKIGGTSTFSVIWLDYQHTRDRLEKGIKKPGRTSSTSVSSAQPCFTRARRHGLPLSSATIMFILPSRCYDDTAVVFLAHLPRNASDTQGTIASREFHNVCLAADFCVEHEYDT